MNKNKFVVLILLELCLIILSSCSEQYKSDDNDEVKKYCEKYALEYKIIEKKEDDVMVSINAPDFKKIMDVLMEEKHNEDITANDIEKAVERYPDYKKDYIFWTDDKENNKIKKEFLEKVSEELMVEAIKNVKYEETWGIEE